MVEFQSFPNPEGESWEFVLVPTHLSVASDDQLSISSSSPFWLLLVIVVGSFD